MNDSHTSQILIELCMSVGSLAMQKKLSADFNESALNDKIQKCCAAYWNTFYELPDNIISFDYENRIVILSGSTIPLGINNLCKLYSENSTSYDFAILQKVFAEYLNRRFSDAIYAYLSKDSFAPSEAHQTEIVRHVDTCASICASVANCVVTSSVKILSDCFMRNEKYIVVTGNSSSGKTTVAGQAIRAAEEYGYIAQWFDFLNVNTTLVNVFCSLLKYATARQRIILVFDNAQARPTDVTQFIQMCADFFSRQGMLVEIVLICWSSARVLIQDIISSTFHAQPKTITCAGEQQVEEIVKNRGYSHYLEDIIRDSNGGDVLVAVGILDYLDQHKNYPIYTRLAEYIYSKSLRGVELSREALHILFVIAALGEFEVHVRKGYLQRISSRGIDELLEQGIVQKYENDDGNQFVYLGHRSKAHKIVNYMSETFMHEAWVCPAESVAIQYLKSEDNGQIHTMLERLDVEVRNSNNVFANLWKAFANVRTHLYNKIHRDPVWGQNAASMIFAAEALCKISFDNRAKLYWNIQAKEIRKRWTPNGTRNGLLYIGDDCFTVNDTTYKMTNEIVDFTENIRSRMIEEEKLLSYPDAECASQLDFYRIHDNWLLGLLLGFEGIAYESEDGLKEAYVECATNMQLDSGAFFPERVPWVTSRVIMGLAQCGLTYDNSILVQSACEWLVNQLSFDLDTEGQVFPCAGWRSGTGSWNSDIQITLMNLVALSMANYPLRGHSDIMNTIKYTIVHAEELAKNATNPLDIVWIIDVLKLQKEKDGIVQLNKLINELSLTTLKIWGDTNKTAYDTQRESSDVSFLTKEFLDIMWYIVTENLGKLLSGLERREVIPNQHKQIFLSYRRSEGGGRLLADSIYDYLNTLYRDSVFLDVHDLEKRCSEFEDIIQEAIENSKVAVIIVSQGAFQRCTQPNYEIEKDVFISEIKAILENEIPAIVVYYDKVELPEELKQNKECYELAERLSKKNAAFFKSDLPNAQEMLGEAINKKIRQIIL